MAGEDELVGRAELRGTIAKDIAARISCRQAEKEIKYMERNSLAAVASTDPEYPHMLRECPDYPHVLYVRGNVNALCGMRMISMVGTRKITPYGQRMCSILTGQLNELEPDATVVSGLAFGVDAGCHKAAMEYGLKCVAVVANVLPEVTPAQNARLADMIVAQGGAIISELNSQTKQNGSYYIPRNRIVAGISAGTVVVESPLEGGSLGTAEMAYGYDRVVMAVPGRAGDRCSEGSNMLIRNRKAVMVCSGGDIVYELGWNIKRAGEIPARQVVAYPLDDDERRIVACFGEGESVGLDILAVRSGMSVGETSAVLMNLEINGVVRSLPGKVYELK